MQKGIGTIFWTLSFAEYHLPEIHTLFDTATDSSMQNYRQNVLNNPHIMVYMFTERVEAFVKHWLYRCLGAEWHWFRYEFAVQRGSIHCHGIAKLKSDPGICSLSEAALRGYLASKNWKLVQMNMKLRAAGKKLMMVCMLNKCYAIIMTTWSLLAILQIRQSFLSQQFTLVNADMRIF